MSGLAKAFVVINLILALFFLGASATLFQVQEGWKKAAEDVGSEVVDIKEQLTEFKAEKEGEISSLRQDKSTITTENEVLKSQNQDLMNANGDLKNQVAQVESRISVLETNLAQKDAHLQDKDDVIAQKEETINTLTREMADAEESAKDAVALANRAQLDRQEIEEQLEQVSIELASVQRENEDKEIMIATARNAGFNPEDMGVLAMPKIDAVVVAVRDGIVVLSVGRDDNVKPGYEFTVYEGRRFIGKVKVENVLGDMSARESSSPRRTSRSRRATRRPRVSRASRGEKPCLISRLSSGKARARWPRVSSSSLRCVF